MHFVLFFGSIGMDQVNSIYLFGIGNNPYLNELGIIVRRLVAKRQNS